MDLTVDMERKYGIVPAGRFTSTTAVRLLSRLLEDYNTITISINEWQGNSKRKWRTYRLVGLQDNKCKLNQIIYKLPEDALEKMKNNEPVDMIPVIQKEIKLVSACDICQMKDAYLARIDVDNQ